MQDGIPLDDVTPVWRVLDKKAPVLKKLSFDPAFILDSAPARDCPHRRRWTLQAGQYR